VDFLLSGIFAAHYVNTASPVLLPNIDGGQNGFFDALLRQVLTQKWNVGVPAKFSVLPTPHAIRPVTKSYSVITVQTLILRGSRKSIAL
jgi:hypothetical protein